MPSRLLVCVLFAVAALLPFLPSPASADLAPAIYQGQWGGTGSDSTHFDDPGAIAIAGDGRRFVADRGNTRVVVFDAKNRPKAILTSTGGGYPMDPDGLAVAADGTLFWMEDTGILQRFSTTYTKIGEWQAVVNGGSIPGGSFQ